jgi:hypothetical protein
VVEELLQQLRLRDLVFDVLVVEEVVIHLHQRSHLHQIPLSGVLLFGQLFTLPLSSRQQRVNVMCGSTC